MPREIRKRGKKKSKVQEDEYPQPAAVAPGPDIVEPSSESAPTWMRNAPSTSNPLADIEAPFGYVDADVKAYFRTIDLKLRDWQDGTNEDTSPEGVDANEGMSICPSRQLNADNFITPRSESIHSCRTHRNGEQRIATGD